MWPIDLSLCLAVGNVKKFQASSRNKASCGKLTASGYVPVLASETTWSDSIPSSTCKPLISLHVHAVRRSRRAEVACTDVMPLSPLDFREIKLEDRTLTAGVRKKDIIQQSERQLVMNSRAQFYISFLSNAGRKNSSPIHVRVVLRTGPGRCVLHNSKFRFMLPYTTVTTSGYEIGRLLGKLTGSSGVQSQPGIGLLNDKVWCQWRVHRSRYVF